MALELVYTLCENTGWKVNFEAQAAAALTFSLKPLSQNPLSVFTALVSWIQLEYEGKLTRNMKFNELLLLLGNPCGLTLRSRPIFADSCWALR